MGTVYTSEEKMLKQTYVLGFTSLEGRAGRITFKPEQQYDVPRRKADDFERWMDRGLAYGFVDFKQYNAGLSGPGEPFNMAGGVMNRHRDSKASWNRVFDGVFYIREMYPCKGAMPVVAGVK